MEKVTIYKFQLRIIRNVLRLTANIHNSRNPQKTAFDRQVVQAEKYAENALKGSYDDIVEYGK